MKEIEKVQKQLEKLAYSLGYHDANQMIDAWLKCAKYKKISEFLRGKDESKK